MRVKLLMHHTKEWRPLMQIVAPNLIEYCNRHDYAYEIWEIKPYSKYTGVEKIWQIIRNWDSADVFLVMDGDTLITNHSIRVEEYLVNGANFLVCEDINGVNTGVFIVKNNDKSRALMYHILSNLLSKEIFDCEQNVIESLLEYPDIKIIPHPAFNSYPYELYKPSYGKIGFQEGDIIEKPTYGQGDWQKGSFVCHLPGKTLPERMKIFTELKEEIIK